MVRDRAALIAALEHFFTLPDFIREFYNYLRTDGPVPPGCVRLVMTIMRAAVSALLAHGPSATTCCVDIAPAHRMREPKRQANGDIEGPCDPRDPQFHLVAKLVLSNLLTEPLNSVSPKVTTARCQLGDYVEEHGAGRGVGGAKKLFMTQV